MRVVTLGYRPGPKHSASTAEYRQELSRISLGKPAWILVYAVHDAPLDLILAELARRHPGVPLFGATSFQGVFTPDGFGRGVAMLVEESETDIEVSVSLQKAASEQAVAAASEACREIVKGLGRLPSVLLLHATPGFEERILEGIQRELGTQVPVYGGSAADDSISGGWRVFSGDRTVTQGFVLAGIRAPTPILGGFLGGFLPAGPAGTVTRASGRTVHEIDGRPAARVYNEWVQGAISDELARGGNVLLKTNLSPLARVVDERFGMPRRLLSHPHEVVGSESLTFFAEFTAGDRVALMTSLRDPMISRVSRAVQRAKGSAAGASRAGLLVYCAGSLGVVLEQAQQIPSEFKKGSGEIPFIGIATFGEQGCFFEKGESRHGNLMCSVLLFD